MGFLDIDSASKSYGSVEVLHNVNISVGEGEFLVLVGPSGCGKSTLLNMIAGLEEITTGEIRLKGNLMNGVHPSRRNIAMVFQSYALYPNMTVAQNITFGLEMLKVPKAERESAMQEVAELLQIGGLLKSGNRRSCQAASGSGWPWGGRLSGNRKSSCLTNRCPTLMRSSASTCGPKSRSSIRISGQRSCT